MSRNYVQIAMMKRYGKTQTVFQDRRTKRSGEKIDWMVEYQDDFEDDFEDQED
jgi:spore coat polysaccharide biosynthesis protein SpsF (cytidylyltransferase family)